MSLFEKIKNKRYDLQEKKKYDPSDALRKAIGKQSELDAARDFKKDVGKDITPEVKGDVKSKIDTSNRFFTDQPDSKTLKTKSTGDEGQFKTKVKFDSGAKGKFVSGSPDLGGTQKKFVKDRRKKLEVGRTTYSKNKKLDKEISARRSAETTKADAINRAMGTSGSTEGAAGASGTTTKTKTVKQSEVSKKAKDFTQKINKKRTRGFENVTGEGQVKYPKTKKELIAKRKEYGIDRKGNISKTGVEKYARNIKQSNLPLTKQDLSTAKQFAVGGKKIKDSTGKVIGTTTGKYGGRLPRARNKNMKTYDQIKRDIDLKDLQKASDAKARKIARSKELKDLTKKMGEKELYQKVTQKAQLKSIRPQRQFYKGALGTTQNVAKALGGKSAKVAPAVKTGLKVVAKAGPAGAIAAGTGLALLNPSIRKTAKKVAKAALGAAGVKAFIAKPKKVNRPPSKIGINLSPKA